MKCEKCKKEIIGYPALSRKDNKSLICSMCGYVEGVEGALESGLISKENAEDILESIRIHESKEN